MVAVGGFRPVDGALFYTNTQHYEHLLLDVRTRMLEAQDTRTRQSYKAVARNYGNIEEEMFSERTVNVTTPNSNANYNQALGDGVYAMNQGTPLFLEQMFTNNTRYAGLVGVNIAPPAVSTATQIFVGTNMFDLPTEFHVGEEVEINGEQRTVASFTPPTATTPAILNLANALSAAPPIGSLVVIKGREYANPHLNETYRVTDKFSSYIVDDNRYQIDRNNGIIRYRPSPPVGTAAPESIWHPEDAINVPYYFGKMIPVKVAPPPAGPGPTPGPDDGVVGNEQLGNPTDPVLQTAGPANITTPAGPLLTSFNLAPPDGQYSNIRITVPTGVSVEVELNGAKIAIQHSGGTFIIPFFDPNYENDQLKANESIDPDVYIQRFVKAGDNNLVIKATRTAAAAGNAGVRVEGMFNGVDLETGAIAATGKPHASISVHTLDWSASRNSILGIVGKLDFDLGDRIALEDVSDEIAKAQGVLESLTTLIAGTDINQFQSMLSVIK